MKHPRPFRFGLTSNGFPTRSAWPAMPSKAEAQGYATIRPLSSVHEGYLATFMDLRDLQMMIWAIEMRNHPAFRTSWEAKVGETLQYIKQTVA